MNILETSIPDIMAIEPKVFGDSRGYFFEVFNLGRYSEASTEKAPLDQIVQINRSHSVRNTLRGLHYQEPQGQGKLVWVIDGAVLDVAVDVRVGSPTFGKHEKFLLTGENHRQVWIPAGFAHGFVVMSDEADFMYACTDLYAPEHEHSILWNDPELGIDWEVDSPILSEKDKVALPLAQAEVLPKYG